MTEKHKLDDRFSDAVLLCDAVDDFSDKKLKRKNDLKHLVTTLLSQEGINGLEEIAFTAKYIQGLIRVLQSGVNNPEIQNLEQIKQDLTEHIKKISEKIGNIVLPNTPGNELFRETYL